MSLSLISRRSQFAARSSRRRLAAGAAIYVPRAKRARVHHPAAGLLAVLAALQLTLLGLCAMPTAVRALPLDTASSEQGAPAWDRAALDDKRGDHGKRACDERKRMPQCREAPSAAPEGMGSAAAELADEDLLDFPGHYVVLDVDSGTVAEASAASAYSLNSRMALDRPPRA